MSPARTPADMPIAGQHWNPTRYALEAAYVPALAETAITLLAPVPGERILDLGCGDGVLSARLAGTGAVITGVDASPSMVAAAVARGVDARLGDAHALPFAQEFDAVFSNAALHWMREPDAVAASVRRALKPGGRFVGEFGGHGNVAAIITALRAALAMHGSGDNGFRWYFPTAAQYRQCLQQEGFTVTHMSLVPRPTPLPHGIDGWLRNFADPFLTGLSDAVRFAVLECAIALLEPSLKDATGAWSADYVRLRFRAHL